MTPSQKDDAPTTCLPSTERPLEPTGAAAGAPAGVMLVAALVIVAVVAFHTWVAIGIGLALMLVCMGAFSLYIRRVTSSPALPDGSHPGDVEYTELSPHDVPRDAPERRVIVRGYRRRHGHVAGHGFG